MSKYPAIPEFTDDAQSMGITLRAVKDSVEQLTGKRQGQSIGSPSMFVQPFAPTPSSLTVLTRGDLWINETNDIMSYWNGSQWKQVL